MLQWVKEIGFHFNSHEYEVLGNTKLLECREGPCSLEDVDEGTFEVKVLKSSNGGALNEARVRGVQLRWWQPRHEGAGHDQWALDHVEVILTRKQNYMMNYSRQTGLHQYYNRKRRALRQRT
ncbi:hypothetical protein cypCar_00030856 [Cyprinus carpio]|nr:hypothetical protein cypCar_00030856 [Cyprinus carpio]